MHPAQHETERSDQTTPAIADDDPIRWPDPSPLDLWWQRVMADTIRRCREAEPEHPAGASYARWTERNRVAG
ncbi:hypothetical protein [Rhodococcus sp. A14]|uniref:hypothetical protein n=1 Tax=Rhodococcus sp. A14 TaxID=1194106 RepID=UPI001421E757|nr:hypothetical protein [Rhodococcus sp. A14]